MNVYVATSWRNERQPEVVEAIRVAGHEVYDFRHPDDEDDGFHWSEIDPKWKDWNSGEFRTFLEHPIAEGGFAKDMTALDRCDACVLVMPCGRSAHLELGYAIGAGKQTAILLSDGEPELMYKMAGAICLDIKEVIDHLALAPAPKPSMTIKELMNRAHNTALNKGWWDNEKHIPEMLALVHSEVSEALEAYREHRMEPTVVDGKPEGFASEVADILIRVADMCAWLQVDLDAALETKMEYNTSRPYRHGGKKC